MAAVGGPSAQPGLGAIVCTSGALMGQRFEIRPEGIYIGRDGTLAQVVISDNRVSKRHVWIGPRNGRVAVVDQGSTNGTFLNVPGSQIKKWCVNKGCVNLNAPRVRSRSDESEASSRKFRFNLLSGD